MPPLASVMFNLDHGSRLELPGLDVEIEPNPNRGAQFELEWNIVDTDSGCPDANQPSLVLTERVGGSKKWACLEPVG